MQVNNLEIVLRTHGNSNVHTDRQRYCGAEKPEVVRRCVTSLINSAEKLSMPVKITVIDDHSSEDVVNSVKAILATSRHRTSFSSLTEKGFNHSALQQFLLCKMSGADLIYSVEDDYLHHPDALPEMIADYQLFTERTGREVCMFGFDMPDSYWSTWMEPSMIVHGHRRHWRTTSWTTNTFMCRPWVLNQYWEPFEKLAREYGNGETHEGNTILQVWRNHVLTFNPIPSLVLHMQFDQQQDPYIDWRSWWDNYTVMR